ncbi:uL15 family ribosomal protein [Candidatus Pacearchaeota archaeon]|nr:uL15 family ribosomal protein [Candidatus Pacearchaeota archaeon]
MKLKKRKKSSRFNGRHTAARGGKKKARGSGHRGGFGMAGTGKRADQKKTLLLNMPEEYFGKKGLKAKKKKYKIINLYELGKMAEGKKELKLYSYKILGDGEIDIPLNITAYAASSSAVKKIEKAGGKVILKKKEGENEK